MLFRVEEGELFCIDVDCWFWKFGVSEAEGGRGEGRWEVRETRRDFRSLGSPSLSRVLLPQLFNLSNDLVLLVRTVILLYHFPFPLFSLAALASRRT